MRKDAVDRVLASPFQLVRARLHFALQRADLRLQLQHLHPSCLHTLQNRIRSVKQVRDALQQRWRRSACLQLGAVGLPARTQLLQAQHLPIQADQVGRQRLPPGRKFAAQPEPLQVGDAQVLQRGICLQQAFVVGALPADLRGKGR